MQSFVASLHHFNLNRLYQFSIYDLWAGGIGIIFYYFLSFTVYDYLENVDYFFDEYYDVFHNKLNLGRVLDEYEKRNPDAIVDMPPSFFFEEFHKRFPDAKVSKSTLTTSILPQFRSGF